MLSHWRPKNVLSSLLQIVTVRRTSGESCSVCAAFTGCLGGKHYLLLYHLNSTLITYPKSVESKPVSEVSCHFQSRWTRSLNWPWKVQGSFKKSTNCRFTTTLLKHLKTPCTWCSTKLNCKKITLKTSWPIIMQSWTSHKVKKVRADHLLAYTTLLVYWKASINNLHYWEIKHRTRKVSSEIFSWKEEQHNDTEKYCLLMQNKYPFKYEAKLHEQV